jgi:kinesin family protein 1
VFTLELQQLSGSKATSKITLIDLAGSEKTQTAKTEGQGLLEGININKSLSCLGACIAGLAKAAAKRDKEEAAKTPEQRAAEAKAKSDGAAKKEAAAAQALKKAAAKGPSKYGVKTGAPPKSVEKSDDFIPFRDSVLTWILRDSLCGNSKTVMLAALSPAGANYHETLSTLRFAAQAKLLRTKAIVNEDPVQRLVAELKAEVEKLKQEVRATTFVLKLEPRTDVQLKLMYTRRICMAWGGEG